MSTVIAIITDLIAITLLGIVYFRRHRRRDLLLAYVVLNIGVLAVASVLTGAQAGLGLGLGLFGVLSIIRLRSDQIGQGEIAYYFSALALGLLAGIQPGNWWVAPAFSALLLAAVFVVDHPQLLARSRRRLLTLDRAHVDERALTAALEQLLGAQVRRVEVIEVDLVRDITVVDVRYRLGAKVTSTSSAGDGHPVADPAAPGWPIEGPRPFGHDRRHPLVPNAAPATIGPRSAT